MTHVDLMRTIHRIRKWEEAHGEPAFMGIPDRWYAPGQFRCINGHVSTTILRSEGLHRDACLACFEPVMMTFPEDKDGPINHAALHEEERR